MGLTKMLTNKKYVIDAEIAPARVSWSETVVMDPDAGDFYVRLTPHVDWAVDHMREGYNMNSYDTRKRYIGRRWYDRPTNVGAVQPSVKGAMRRNEIAQQGKKIFAELKKEWTADAQKKLRAEANKRRGQRWNKKG